MITRASDNVIATSLELRADISLNRKVFTLEDSEALRGQTAFPQLQNIVKFAFDSSWNHKELSGES